MPVFGLVQYLKVPTLNRKLLGSKLDAGAVKSLHLYNPLFETLAPTAIGERQCCNAGNIFKKRTINLIILKAVMKSKGSKQTEVSELLTVHTVAELTNSLAVFNTVIVRTLSQGIIYSVYYDCTKKKKFICVYLETYSTCNPTHGRPGSAQKNCHVLDSLL